MKARVYGFGIDHYEYCGYQNNPANYKLFNGEIVDISKYDQYLYLVKYANKNYLMCDFKMEQIKEITITEEDFDKAVRNSVVRRLADTANPRSFEIYIKEELFKESKWKHIYITTEN